MLSRTADITHGFCISHGEISSSTRNLLFRLAVVAQICGLFRPLPLSPDENSLSKFPFLSFPFPFLSLLFSLLFFSSLFFRSPSPPTGVDTVSLSTADDSIERNRGLGKWERKG